LLLLASCPLFHAVGGPSGKLSISGLRSEKFAKMLLLLCAAFGAASAFPPSAVARARSLVRQMTLDEKIQLLHGNGMYPVSGFAGDTCTAPANPSANSTCAQYAVPRLKIPPVLLQDGPQGVKTTNRKGNIIKSSTQFPALVGIGASWDPTVAHMVGVAMGTEFRGKGANNQEGPGMNIHRVPYNGRNCEYVSGEDPTLGAAMASALVTGIQSQGVVACAKHFVLNNQVCAP
jgi:beta-glucosidase